MFVWPLESNYWDIVVDKIFIPENPVVAFHRPNKHQEVNVTCVPI
jgi:hypothetical protein